MEERNTIIKVKLAVQTSKYSLTETVRTKVEGMLQEEEAKEEVDQ